MVKLYLIAPLKEGLLEGTPFSLLHLGEWVRKNTDCFVEIVENIEQITEQDAFVGISVTTPTYQKGLALAREVKEKNLGIKTILGGYHTKGQSKFIAEHTEIDFVVEGEGEKSLVKILEGNSDKVIFGEALTSEELDSIRISDLFKLDSEYFQTMQQFGIINYISTRGCPYSCSFCTSSGKLSKTSVGLVDENDPIRETNVKALVELGQLAKEYDSDIEIFPHLSVVYPGTPDFMKMVLDGVPEDIFETYTKWEEENGNEIKELLSKNKFIHGAGGIPQGILDLER
ncbi:MAG: cobalamin-dependent protein, partial [Nanoarchaeota archaeon]|nr:cobalamin-dependent protein [Nanoarchaeota archaeon]